MSHTLKYLKWVVKNSSVGDLSLIAAGAWLIICSILVVFIGLLYGILSFFAGIVFAVIVTFFIVCCSELMKSWEKFLKAEADEADEIARRLKGDYRRRH